MRFSQNETFMAKHGWGRGVGGIRRLCLGSLQRTEDLESIKDIPTVLHVKQHAVAWQQVCSAIQNSGKNAKMLFVQSYEASLKG